MNDGPVDGDGRAYILHVLSITPTFLACAALLFPFLSGTSIEVPLRHVLFSNDLPSPPGVPRRASHGRIVVLPAVLHAVGRQAHVVHRGDRDPEPPGGWRLLPLAGAAAHGRKRRVPERA